MKVIIARSLCLCCSGFLHVWRLNAQNGESKKKPSLWVSVCIYSTEMYRYVCIWTWPRETERQCADVFSSGSHRWLAAAHIGCTEDMHCTLISYSKWPGVGSHAPMKSHAFTHKRTHIHTLGPLFLSGEWANRPVFGGSKHSADQARVSRQVSM